MIEYVYVCMNCLDSGDGAYLSDSESLTECSTCQGKVYKIGFISKPEVDPHE